MRGSGTTTQGLVPLKPRAVVMAVVLALYDDCVGAHAPDIKAVNARRHGLAGPAQGIGGDDDVEPRAGGRAALPLQKIADHLAFDFAAAGAGFAGPSGPRCRLLEGDFLAIGLQPFFGGKAALMLVGKHQFAAAIAERRVGGGALNQEVGEAVELRQGKPGDQQDAARIFGLAAGQAQN